MNQSAVRIPLGTYVVSFIAWPTLSGRLSISHAGVTLMVDAHGDEPSERLTFYKTQTRTIYIGRKSGQTGAKADAQDGDSALFRCPVISRKHAKITFTDFGNVCLLGGDCICLADRLCDRLIS